ncbi:hypothetical protein, partial [Pseudomonas sp. FG-3G]
ASHATGPCDNLARAVAGKLDRRQAGNHRPGHSLAAHQESARRTSIAGPRGSCL